MAGKKKGYCSRISEVTIGATNAGGGTRNRSHVIGGENAPAFHYSEGYRARRPVISHDVFDTLIPLPSNVRNSSQM